MVNYDWITWTEIKAGNKQFDSADVEVQSQAIINEACQTVLDDLSGYYDLTMMIASQGVPRQLARLATYKAREIAAIYFWGAPSETNQSSTHYRDEYKFLLESIRQGYIQVEGYAMKANSKVIHYY